MAVSTNLSAETAYLTSYLNSPQSFISIRYLIFHSIGFLYTSCIQGFFDCLAYKLKSYCDTRLELWGSGAGIDLARGPPSQSKTEFRTLAPILLYKYYTPPYMLCNQTHLQQETPHSQPGAPYPLPRLPSLFCAALRGY
jgi:hypothetical protein